MTGQTVLYDACVLYPAPLRDLLIRLALTGLFQAKWTEEIHREWMSNLLKDRPDLRLDQLERTRQAMNASVLDCLVEDYESLIPKLNLPDEDDRHVLAAAIEAKASMIITFNLTDFPLALLSGYGIVAQHPDEFVVNLMEMDYEVVCEAVERQRRALKNPPKSVAQHLDTLLSQRLTQTVARLKRIYDEGAARRGVPLLKARVLLELKAALDQIQKSLTLKSTDQTILWKGRNQHG